MITDDFIANDAPGLPGMEPSWCTGAKQMVGTTLGPSRVWFTIGDGILNEIYYPRVDIPQVRDLGFIVADGKGFWVEVKRLRDCEVETAGPGIPAVTIVHRHARFTLTLRIVPESNRDVLLIDSALDGDAPLQLYVLLAPRLGGSGRANVCEVAMQHGRRALWARQGPFGLALLAVDARQTDAFGACSAGYSGSTDGWQDFDRHGALRFRYRRAGPGNVALTGALARHAVLALGFSTSCEAATTLALSSLLQPFDLVWKQQIEDWLCWHRQSCAPRRRSNPDRLPAALRDQLDISAMVLRTHQDQTFRGAMVASLSVPWGQTAQERPGYLWSGRAIWSSARARCWRWAPTSRRARFCAI